MDRGPTQSAPYVHVSGNSILKLCPKGLKGGRGERIRTSDLSVPNRAHYQAVLRPEILKLSRNHSPQGRHSKSGNEDGQADQSLSSRKSRILANARAR
jgi:hypothetical protein